MLRSKGSQVGTQVLDEDHLSIGFLDRVGQPFDLDIDHHGPVPQERNLVNQQRHERDKDDHQRPER